MAALRDDLSAWFTHEYDLGRVEPGEPAGANITRELLLNTQEAARAYRDSIEGPLLAQVAALRRELEYEVHNGGSCHDHDEVEAECSACTTLADTAGAAQAWTERVRAEERRSTIERTKAAILEAGRQWTGYPGGVLGRIADFDVDAFARTLAASEPKEGA